MNMTMNTSATKPMTAPVMSGTADCGSEITMTMPELNTNATEHVEQQYK